MSRPSSDCLHAECRIAERPITERTISEYPSAARSSAGFAFGVRLAGRVLALFLISVMGTACVSHAGFRQKYLQSRQDLLNGNWDAAARKYMASKKQYGKRDRVMYWLNLGTLQHYAGQWKQSQDNFVKAERAIQDLFTKSITAEASKYTVSETLAPYEGEDFEKVLLYYYTALNNVSEGRVSDALVEARRADEFLKKIRVKYDKDKDLSTLYKQDAFMLWLVGLFYEVEGSYSDAFLAYRRAFKVYRSSYRKLFRTPPPSYVAADVMRAGRKAGLESDALAFAQRYNLPLDTPQEQEAEVIVIHGGGEAPFKRQTFFTAPMPDGYILRIAFPQMQLQKGQVFTSFAEIAGQSVETEMAEPVSLIALKNFKHQLPGLRARAIVRAT
ncbi:MAG: hypothetical protein AAFN74_15540, partial [Myxococcota bacterium]